jgi:hypothetical protein
LIKLLAKVLDNYEVIDTYQEYWPGEDIETLYISKVKIFEDQFNYFIEKLSNQWIEDGWFAVVWNDKKVFVVLKNKMYNLQNIDPWNKQEFSELLDYGKQYDIDKKYFLINKKLFLITLSYANSA